MVGALAQATSPPWQIVPTQEEQQVLLRRAVSYGQIVDKAAFDELVVRNQALVIHVAKHHIHKCKTLEMGDLVNIGYEGLRQAILRFDRSRSEALSTCAMWWIRQSITRGIEEQDAMVRLPTHMHSRLRRESFEQSQVGHLAMVRADEQVMQNAQQTRHVYSLDTPMVSNTGSLHRSDESSPLADLLADPQRNFEDWVCERLDRQQMLDKIIGRADLTLREAYVVAYRMGIAAGADGQAQSLEAVGAKLGVTRERIRQIEAKAMVKLRAAALKEGYGEEMQPIVRPEHTKAKVGVERVKRKSKPGKKAS